MKDLLILGAAVPGEASETMVKLFLWPSIVLLRKLAIYCNYIWYILRTPDFYELGLQKSEKTYFAPIHGYTNTQKTVFLLCKGYLPLQPYFVYLFCKKGDFFPPIHGYT